jgi:hypothetical protein
LIIELNLKTIDFTYANGIKAIDTIMKKTKKITIMHKYCNTNKKLLSPINLSDFLIIKAKGINGITKALKGTIAEMNAP